MNERITLLALKASDPKTGWLDRQKFAELIVRECAKVCRDQSNEYAMELDRENCASAIEEHFGVEE